MGSEDYLETPIGVMYHAGKVDIPAEGDYLQRIANRLHDHLQTLDKQSASAGDPRFLRTLLQVTGDVYEVLGPAVRSLDNAAAAVIATADDFRIHDARAAADFRSLEGALKNDPLPHHTQPGELTDPETPGATTPSHFGVHDVHTPSTPAPTTPKADHDQREPLADGADVPVIRPED